MRKLPIMALASAALLGIAVGGVPTNTSASSHREAPYTSTDPQVDGTDLYAFVSNDRRDLVTLIANYIPVQGPRAAPTSSGLARTWSMRSTSTTMAMRRTT